MPRTNSVPPMRRNYLLFGVVFVLSLFCAAGIILLYGRPYDAATWFTLAFGLLSCFPLLARHRWKVFYCLPFLYYFLFIIPVQRYGMLDVQGGRTGVLLMAFNGETRFVRDGPNTQLLEDYLGPLEAKWDSISLRSMLLGTFRDGHDRVYWSNIIFMPELPEILAMLPDNRARVQVLRCVTDRENILRLHQGVLLLCLWSLDYPEGYDAESWWSRHQHLFRHEYDQKRAALTVAGWMQLLVYNDRSLRYEVCNRVYATREFERGGWGNGFGGEASNLEKMAENEGKDIPDNGLLEVVWWKEVRPVLRQR